MSEFAYIKDMRQRLGLEPDDARRDTHIAAMSPLERFQLLCGWHLGDPGWASTMLAWAKDAGLHIEARKES